MEDNGFPERDGVEAAEHDAAPALDPSDVPPSQRGIRRRELLPAWVVISAAALIALIVGAVIAVPAVVAAGRVTVPDVTGLPLQAATDRLKLAGLKVERGDERFSPQIPKGSVIEQTPAGGTRTAKGSVVVLVLSAGTETFAMPDVVGKPLEAARKLLAERGLSIRVDVVASQAASGTVISTIPAPGARVTTSDVVRVTVAGRGEASSALLPYRLEGLAFTLDPSPVATGTTDVPMEVARRVRALLEASGATVTVTRDATHPAPSSKARIAAATKTKPNAVIGLRVAVKGTGGLGVITPPASAARSRFNADQRQLAQRLATELRDSNRIVRVASATDDVLAAVPSPGIRLGLGSTADRADDLAFRDPRWSDEIARAVYRAIGEVFAK